MTEHEWEDRVYSLQQTINELRLKYDELLSYLPKVPTEPYEKALAKENAELKAKLKIAKKAIKKLLPLSLEVYGAPEGAEEKFALKALEQIGGEG